MSCSTIVGIISNIDILGGIAQKHNRLTKNSVIDSSLVADPSWGQTTIATRYGVFYTGELGVHGYCKQ